MSKSWANFKKYVVVAMSISYEDFDEFKDEIGDQLTAMRNGWS